ncbi:hypothetical protein Gasu2_34100 [Galdieria sulphuraria]|uniref:Uncharacterized protein n=1 Tax=Galdieria sulphuraria TaxID=130081 RepID=M2VSL1_GALSU|nr:uncharacterized protein Gasu_62270 [Galdieria sulphuraria]EME26131.1 hypothetical protein Gasu_62270 [Galdieria sulphuraria]GJD09140.1 hypothetical protein Gasu2_34100 [Galdieria sulphuraria]|eukprot:XP_005702651.1 hypothetical protein Gasu_62270 [Galdieria sulphuraria]
MIRIPSYDQVKQWLYLHGPKSNWQQLLEDNDLHNDVCFLYASDEEVVFKIIETQQILVFPYWKLKVYPRWHYLDRDSFFELLERDLLKYCFASVNPKYLLIEDSFGNLHKLYWSDPDFKIETTFHLFRAQQ